MSLNDMDENRFSSLTSIFFSFWNPFCTHLARFEHFSQKKNTKSPTNFEIRWSTISVCLFLTQNLAYKRVPWKAPMTIWFKKLWPESSHMCKTNFWFELWISLFLLLLCMIWQERQIANGNMLSEPKTWRAPARRAGLCGAAATTTPVSAGSQAVFSAERRLDSLAITEYSGSWAQ